MFVVVFFNYDKWCISIVKNTVTLAAHFLV